MVIKDGVVQLERYQYDRTPAQRLLSNSMAKSITSVAGIALQEGRIRSLDDNAAVYVPELSNFCNRDGLHRHRIALEDVKRHGAKAKASQ